MKRALRCSAVADDRIAVARGWLESRRKDERVLVVGATTEAAHALVRSIVMARGSVFGWHVESLASLARELALDVLAERRLVPAGSFAHEALAARALAELERADALGRFAAVAHTPRLPRAIASTLDEIRMAALDVATLRVHDETLSRALEATMDARRERGLADRATVLEIAASVARAGAVRDPLGLPTLLLDVSLATAAERAFVTAFVSRSPDVLATVPDGDARSLGALEHALGVAATTDAAVPDADGNTLRRAAHFLFRNVAAPKADAGPSVSVLSAPGERRECNEIVREILREARAGTAFDRMAVALHRPRQYRDHLDQALRRAGIPAHFARGTSEPHPAGRAMLALLACASEGLSARRFAEYLSLAEVPDADASGAPAARAADWVPADDDLGDALTARTDREGDRDEDYDDDDDDRERTEGVAESATVVGGTLRAPRRWEQLLVDAAVIGGRERWQRRLAGEAARIARTSSELAPDAAERDRAQRAASELAALQQYALPLLDELDALRTPATWGVWIERLERLAARALRHPRRVLACLADLRPMSAIGPVSLAEVRRVLAPRLGEIVRPVHGPSAGRVAVVAIAGLRGRAFDVVFAPGLAERLFPSKLTEDPILRDAARRALSSELAVSEDAVERERLALRLVVGGARRRLVLSFPRMDLEQARPRVPSFYGLEVFRAAEGRLPGFDELAERAEKAARTRIGWPAPDSPLDAVDDAEHDLALLDSIFRMPEGETLGAASYLLGENEHLARALRARARRWRKRWGPNDGLVLAPDASSAARAAIAEHAFDRRSFSATALERFARCPFSFYLYAAHRLQPREVPEAIERIDPLSRGSLTHEAQFATLVALQRRGWLPIPADHGDDARDVLDHELDVVAARYHDDLAPAIERIWQDGLAEIRADLREWLRQTALETSWVPWRFELSFGLAGDQREHRDEHSQDDPVALPIGLQLRGSIDLVEKRASDASLRATDHKTGKASVPEGAVVNGGTSLQPLLYAMALDTLFPNLRIESGRLSYCTVRGGYEERVIDLDDRGRTAIAGVLDTIRDAIDRGFLPAAPAPDACRWCDYLRVCGPNEERRVAGKPPDRLRRLVVLRDMP